MFGGVLATPDSQNFYAMARLFIKTVGAASGTAYAWTEQLQSSPGVFIDDPNGRSSGVTGAPAYMADGSTTVASGTICEAVIHYAGWLIAWPIVAGGGCCNPNSTGGQASLWTYVSAPSTYLTDAKGPNLSHVGGFSWTWTVPDCVTGILVECFGAGGESYWNPGTGDYPGGGGGGGYSASTLTVVPGDVYTVNLSQLMGASSFGVAFLGTDGVTVLVSAQNGGVGAGYIGGAGAPTTNATGTVKYAGGAGGDNVGIAIPYIMRAGGSGGGGAGPAGNGENGQNGVLGPAAGIAGPPSIGGGGYSSGGSGGTEYGGSGILIVQPTHGSFPGGGDGGINVTPLPTGTKRGLVRITWGVVFPHPIDDAIPTGDGITVSVSEGVAKKATLQPVTEARLESGLVLHPSHAGTVLAATNSYGSTISAGMVVATHSSGTGFILADATDTTKTAIGIARAAVTNGSTGDVQCEGLIKLSDWTASVGSATLAARTTYFLDPANPGKLTATPPATAGQLLQVVGESVSDDTMNLIFSSPILL